MKKIFIGAVVMFLIGASLFGMLVISAVAAITGTSWGSASAALTCVDETIDQASAVVWPLPEGSWTLTSRYGPRTHPVFGGYDFHWGDDFAAVDGTKLLAIITGEITAVERPSSGNNYVTLVGDFQGERIAFRYIHMEVDGIAVEVGQQVAAGQVIAFVGRSGTATGSHLHLELSIPANAGRQSSYLWLVQNGTVSIPESCLTPQEEDLEP